MPELFKTWPTSANPLLMMYSAIAWDSTHAVSIISPVMRPEDGQLLRATASDGECSVFTGM